MKKIIQISIFLFISAFSFGQSIILDPSATGNGKLRVKSNVQTYGSISTTQTQGGLDFRNTEPSGGDGSTGNLIGAVGTNGKNMNIYTHADFTDVHLNLYTSGSAGNVNLATSGGYIAASTIGIERMRITSSGNVGIGTSAPTGRLQINHNSFGDNNNPILRLRATDDNYSIRVRSENSTGSRYFLQQFSLLSPTASSNFYNINYGSNNLLTITGDGRFGINNTTPSDLLHLSPISATGDVFARISSTDGFTGLRLQNNGGDWQLFSNEFDRMFLDYSPDNFETRTGVLVFKPNGSDFDVQPTTNNKVFLGSSSLRWKEIWSVNALNTSSDRRLKKNINEIKYGLEDVLKLNAVSYNWKNNTDPKLHLGFIAQEVDKIIPEIVSKSNLSDEEFEKLQKKGELPSDTYGMEYTGLIPVLVKAIQEQQRIIEGESQKISQLEARLSAIEASLNMNKNAENKADK